jgi:hypothetical protein
MQDKDPIVIDVKISPGVVLGVNFVLLMISMLSFVQSVRMHIHAVRSLSLSDLELPSQIPTCPWMACLLFSQHALLFVSQNPWEAFA